MKRLWLAGAAAVLTAAAVLLGGSLAGSGGATPLTVAQLDRRGNELARQVIAGDDPSSFARAEQAYGRALRLAPNDLPATIGLGALALSRHHFRSGLALGRRALALSPSTAAAYGVVGDALLELGRYEQAFAAFDKMVSLKPSVSSYARISYARELLGDVRGAAAAMQLAVDAAAGEPDAQAWSRTQLGTLYRKHGRPAAAAREFHAALRVRPGYVYALDGLARVDARHAVALERRAAEALPLPQFVIALGNLLHGEARERQYALARTIFRRQRKGGFKVDLEEALFELDHGDVRRGLVLARAARVERPSIDGDDVLAWALARNGRCREALSYSRRALRLGTRDPKKLAHHAYIERCLRRAG